MDYHRITRHLINIITEERILTKSRLSLLRRRVYSYIENFLSFIKEYL